MKKGFIILVVIALVGVFVWLSRSKDFGALDATTGGTIVNMDLEQAIADGPYVIVLETDDGIQEVVNVPSMGMPLCAARDNIESPSLLRVGMKVEVKGALTPSGIIVPCELPEHYLRTVVSK